MAYTRLPSARRPTTCVLVVASRNLREFSVGLIVNTDFVYLVLLNPVLSFLPASWGPVCQLEVDMATATTQVVQGKAENGGGEAGKQTHPGPPPSLLPVEILRF